MRKGTGRQKRQTSVSQKRAGELHRLGRLAGAVIKTIRDWPIDGNIARRGPACFKDEPLGSGEGIPFSGRAAEGERRIQAG